MFAHMRYRTLACDYDSTLAKDGAVNQETYDALVRLKESGRRLLLVTGRELDDLFRVFPGVEVFDRVVAENGALVYDPATKKSKTLGEKPPDAFVAALKKREIAPLSVGQVIISTWHPNEVAVMKIIQQLGLELQIVFNKGAVMILPAGVNKATGMAEALRDLKLSFHNVVAIGDAENDHAFLKMAELSVAVSNALPMVKETADLVTARSHGAGVVEIIDLMLSNDLATVSELVKRQQLEIGRTAQGSGVCIAPYATNVLVAGASGGSKTTLATSFLERLIQKEYQFCINDPEGDYSELEGVVAYGDSQQSPNLEGLLSTLEKPNQNVVASLLAVPMEDRPAYFEKLLLGLQDLRSRYSRPHWIIINEPHHLLPEAWRPTAIESRWPLQNLFLITADPESVSQTALSLIDAFVVIGKSVNARVESFAKIAGRRLSVPVEIPADLEAGEALLWRVTVDTDPVLFQFVLPRGGGTQD